MAARFLALLALHKALRTLIRRPRQEAEVAPRGRRPPLRTRACHQTTRSRLPIRWYVPLLVKVPPGAVSQRQEVHAVLRAVGDVAAVVLGELGGGERVAGDDVVFAALVGGPLEVEQPEPGGPGSRKEGRKKGRGKRRLCGREVDAARERKITLQAQRSSWLAGRSERSS
ncbi:hypothetical protein FIBSPDRAFT_970394 [Athelia psychrophila]|uniref:Secreted protein n=1 Tax=Athelia psychrophila TaxID=1759441 RepID=A0A167SQK0_9AGAM|nr:hypothetical protein FIBSPDRAFT_970394 [Fibularhizoctonia sp. CBS 109695]